MSPSGAPIVSLRNVGKTFDSGTVALEGFNLDVRAGEFVSLLREIPRAAASRRRCALFRA